MIDNVQVVVSSMWGLIYLHKVINAQICSNSSMIIFSSFTINDQKWFVFIQYSGCYKLTKIILIFGQLHFFF